MPQIQLPPPLQRLLEGAADTLGLVNPRFDTSLATKAGDNYMGVLYRVTLRGDAQAEQDDAGMSVILKALPANREYREMIGSLGFFLNEATMYTKVLPEFAELLSDKGLLSNEHGVCPSTPRCLGMQLAEEEDDDEECEPDLVLQDMVPLGFAMLDRSTTAMDLEHLRLALRTLAGLHAASMALEQLRPERFAQLRAGLRERLFGQDSVVGSSLKRGAAKACTMIQGRFPAGSDGHEKVKHFADNFDEMMLLLITPDPQEVNTITHGDCWFNNMLFKYSPPGRRVEEVCFVDFQLSRYAPPMLDVAYLVYVCSERSLRLAHGEALLRDYHSALTGRLDEILGSAGAGARLYSWDSMRRQLRRCARFGLGMAVTLLPLFLSETRGDLDPRADRSPRRPDDAPTYRDAANAERDRRLADIVEEFLELGYFGDK